MTIMLRYYFSIPSACLYIGGLPLLLIAIPLQVYSQPADSNVILISESDMDSQNRLLYISDLWKFMPGDDLNRASIEYDDSDWSLVSTYLSNFDLAFLEWEGVGWFRLHIEVDSSLINVPIALLIDTHNGASEIYLNGEKQFSLGSFSNSRESYEPHFDKRPRILVFPEPGPHVIAVRYANFQSDLFLDMKRQAGFRFLLGDAEYHLSNQNNGYTSGHTFWQIFFFGGLLVFVMIHALLFSFNRDEQRNLYFALFTGFLALLIGYTILVQVISSPVIALYLYKLGQIIWILTALFALIFAYSLFYSVTPLFFWIFALFGTVVMLFSWFSTDSLIMLRELFLLVVVLEIFRVLVLVYFRKERGVWIIGTGMLFFAGSILYRVIVNVDLMEGDSYLGNFFGFGMMILAMSVFLSRDFAQTRKNLGDKLDEVRMLSEKAIEQERINKEIEIETKLLEAENSRKTKELEEARALQLSMLPRKLPDLPHLNISVWMETANEVGGDYYDYHLSKDGCITFVLGDATGHGLKAGIMVATAKSYFHTLAGEFENLSILHKMSSGFRHLDLKLMFMGILLLKYTDYRIELSSAGMPPVLWYQSDNNRIERVVSKSLPLGTKIEFEYESVSIEVKSGDVLLLMTDGLMELFDENREMIGLDRIELLLQNSSDMNPGDIVNQYKHLMSQWAGQKNNEDDITLMVIKVK